MGNTDSKEFKIKIDEIFGTSTGDVRQFSPLTLAYIGDAVYEIVIRTIVVERGNKPANALHRESIGFVKAAAQAEMIKAIEPELTEEEEAVFKRGRNAKSYTMAKNATMSDYRTATGFEALCGYLYLNGESDRMLELIRRAIELTGREI